jgi:hypothetical protein
MHGFALVDEHAARHCFRLLVLSQFVAVSDNLPHGWLSQLPTRVKSEPNPDDNDRVELFDLVQRIVGNTQDR